MEDSQKTIKRKPLALIFIGFRHKTHSIIAAHEAGFKTILLTRKTLPKATELFDEIVEGEMLRPEFISSLAPKLKKQYRIKGIISNYEHYVVARSYLAERLGIPSTAVYSACCSRNKAMMRHALKFMKENIDFRIVTTEKQALRAFQSLGEDVFIKSISGIKSRLIFHANTTEKVSNAIKQLKQSATTLDEDLYDDYKYCDFHFKYPDPRKTFLVEKAITGQQITISSLANSHSIWHMPSATDIYTARDIGRDDSFLAFRIQPSKHSPDIISKAKKTVETAAHILGLRFSPIFCDLIITPDNEIKLIEIASRNGGYRSQMYLRSHNLNIDKKLVQAVIGKKKSIKNKFKAHVSFLEIFPNHEGKLSHVENLNLIQNDPDVHLFEEILEKGTPIGKARDNFPPVLRFSITDTDYDRLYKKSIELQKKLIVHTQ